jgi:hypothetical protein
MSWFSAFLGNIAFEVHAHGVLVPVVIMNIMMMYIS